MKHTSRKFGFGRIATAWSALMLGLAAASAQTSSLLLNFGPTVSTGTDGLLSMGHFSGAVPAASISWNQILNANVASGLLYADGSAATGVSVTLGRSDAGSSSAIDFTTLNITSSALGGSEKVGIYTNTSPVKDGIFATGTATVNTNAVGIRVNGLTPGTYTIYISGRNTSTAVTAPEVFSATNHASASSFAFSSNTTPSTVEANSASAPGVGNPNAALAITSTFAYGDNCALLVVTLGTGDSLYLSAIGEASTEFRGFLSAVEIVPGSPILTNFPATIGVQPAGTTAYAGSTVTIGGAKFGGVPPLFYQWNFNGVPIPGATSPTLTLSDVTASVAGDYTVSVSNEIAVAVSSNAVLNVVTLLNNGQMTNIWNILPGTTNYPYITTTAGGERGLAFDTATTNLLLLTHSPTNNLVVLNPATGSQEYFMNLSGIATNAAGVNMIRTADDGTVYGANVVAAAGSASTPYLLWQWTDDNTNTVPELLFSGDPGYGTQAANLRWGDNLAVRGAGASTEILIAPGIETNGYGTNIIMFTTPDGVDFSPVVIGISGVSSGFAQNGIAFGPGTNTFWAKTSGQDLYLIQFDISAQTGSVEYAYGPTNNVPSTFEFISTDATQTWLAGVTSVASGLPDNVSLYNISNLTNGPVLADQSLNLTANQNSFNNGIGAGSSAFGGNYFFTLDSQNGIRAFEINTNTVLGAFDITSITSQPGPSVVLTWQSVPGHSYQVQATTSLLGANWSNLGGAIMANQSTTSATNAISGSTKFYRVQGQ